MLSMLKAECFQCWPLESQWELASYQATMACLDLLLGLIVPGILSLRKLMCQGHSGQIPENMPAIWQMDTTDQGLLHPQCPEGQVTCFVISFSFPLGPQIFLSLCIRKTDSGLR